MADQKVKVILEADDRASGKVKQAQSAFSSFGSYLKGAFTFSLRDVAAGFRLLKDAVVLTIGAAAESEAALNRTANAMKAAGTFSGDALLKVSAFAEQLSKTTGVSDEAGLALFSLARSFTATNREAAELVTVAADFSVASGKGLEESVIAIAAAMNGATRGVAKFLPEIANLTEEQLRNGEATRLLGERYAGLAAGGLDTLTGQFARNKNAVGELAEAFGEGLKGTNDLKNAVAELNDVLESKEAEGFFTRLGEAIRGLTLSVVSFLPSGKGLADVLGSITRAASVFSPFLRDVLNVVGLAKQSFSDYATVAQLSDQATVGLAATTRNAAAALREAAGAVDNQKSKLTGLKEETAGAKEETQGLATETAAAAASQKVYTAAYDAYIASVNASAQANVSSVDSLLAARAAVDSVTGAVDRGTQANQRYTASVAAAASAAAGFDSVLSSGGSRAQATSAAVSGGGTLSSGGRRVSLPGGGSRLTFAPGERGPGLRYS